MKTFAVLLGLVLILATLAYAEQKIVYNYPRAEWGGRALFLKDDCISYCSGQSSDVDGYLRNGWHVVWTGPAEIVESPFRGGNTYCRCIGSKYVLEK
jgi:hypothetical protein